MLVKHIMTSPVLTIPSNTPVLEASKIMKERGFERLPIVEGGKLIGIVTKDRLLETSPSKATSLSIQELNYIFAKLTVGEVMEKSVVSVSPEDTVESAVRLAQEKKVGALPVVEYGKVVGILTTNDFFYLILNPVLGIGEGGSRVVVRQCDSTEKMRKALECAENLGLKILNSSYLHSRRGGEHDFILHFREDSAEYVKCLREAGLVVEERSR